MIKRFTILFAAIFVLSACSELELGSHIAKNITMPGDQEKHIGYFKVGNPYKIKGRKYYPAEKYQFIETGVASWYGPGFHGKMTANGEIFNQNELTAAHRTLQMPSMVRVTNLENGKSIIVRVNDRGPFAHDRVIDLSKKAAEVIGMKHQGTAKVRVEVLEKESRIVASAAKQGLSTRGTEVALNRGQPMQGLELAMATPISKPIEARHNPGVEPITIADNQSFVPQRKMFDQVLTDQLSQSGTSIKPSQPQMTVAMTPDNYFIQAGAFSSEDNAMTMKMALNQIEQPVRVQRAVESGSPIYRVKIGPVSGLEKANEILTLLNRQGRDATLLAAQN